MHRRGRQRCSIKKLLLKILQYSLENMCWTWSPQSLFKKDSRQVLSYEYCKMFKNTYFEKYLWMAAFYASLQIFLNFLIMKKQKKQNNLQDRLVKHLKIFQKEGQKKFPKILDSTWTDWLMVR